MVYYGHIRTLYTGQKITNDKRGEINKAFCTFIQILLNQNMALVLTIVINKAMQNFLT